MNIPGHQAEPDDTDADLRAAVEGLVDRAFGPATPPVGALSDVNHGRGAFSIVLRAELPGNKPATVVAKLPVEGPNRVAAATSGAYRREALAYRTLLHDAPIATPTVYAVDEPGDDTCALLLEDLSNHRHADQLIGLSVDDAETVAQDLTRFHRSWAQDDRLSQLPLRHNTVATLPIDGLSAGLAALNDRWADVVDHRARQRYAALVAGLDRLVERFEAETPTLCHGDPRADNLVFDATDRTVLFDWQQMAVQFGEADLAWLAATSLTVETRREADRRLVEANEGDLDRYRLGFALPGLTVLLLAQRDLPTERSRQFAAVSLQRIAVALDDLDVTALAG